MNPEAWPNEPDVLRRFFWHQFRYAESVARTFQTAFALIANMARETGASVVSTNNAAGKAIEIETLGRKRIALLTPYVAELNQAIRAGLERCGLTVVHMAGLGTTDNFGIYNVTPAEIVAFAERELVSRPAI